MLAETEISGGGGSGTWTVNQIYTCDLIRFVFPCVSFTAEWVLSINSPSIYNQFMEIVFADWVRFLTLSMGHNYFSAQTEQLDNYEWHRRQKYYPPPPPRGKKRKKKKKEGRKITEIRARLTWKDVKYNTCNNVLWVTTEGTVPHPALVLVTQFGHQGQVCCPPDATCLISWCCCQQSVADGTFF